jgi:hypothetical protein
MSVKRAHSEAGFTMISVVLGLTFVIALSVVAVTAVRGDLNMNRHDLDRKRAYEAAKAGVNDYVFHLHDETDYWAKCTNVKPATNAVNQVGSTAKRRAVPGNTGAAYAIELLPAGWPTENVYSQCDPASPGPSMLESSGLLKGTFRIRSTGFAGDTSVSIIATFKPATFLDYVYYTQRETLDPISYGYANPSSQLDGVNSQCSKSFEEGRMSSQIPSAGGYCVVISFVQGDSINGPMHTNDAFAFCGEPVLGRSPSDPIEVSGPPPGWFETGNVPHSGSSCDGDDDRVKGTIQAESPLINPPPSNSALKSIAGLKFAGQVRICLSGNNLTASYGKTCTENPAYSGAFPSNGVIYVESTSCSTIYSPFTATYPASSGCGNAHIRGEYTGQLTVATENDIIVDGNLIHSGEGVLGLIANNFVRVYHPFSSDEVSTQTGRGNCNGGSNGAGSIKDLRIDAAILAIDHSFIVDHYDCGADLGTLTVNGALAMKYRGPVGTTGGRGYIKDYNYDDRLRYLQPPHFIEPAESDWVVGRMTIE